MHVLLTDLLVCPRCGPEWGLILLAGETVERRVQSGALSCPNCRTRFRIEAGVADLRLGAAGAGEERLAGQEVDDAVRLAALLGVTEGPGVLVVVGAGAVHAAGVAEVVPNVEVIAVHTGAAPIEARARVSALRASGALPLRDRGVRGVALTAGAEALVEDAARVVAPRARVVVTDGSDAMAERLTRAGLRVLARDARGVVAERGAF